MGRRRLPRISLGLLLLQTPLVFGQDSATAPVDRLKALAAQQQLLYEQARYAEAQEAGLQWIQLAGQVGDLRQVVEAHYETARAFVAQKKDQPASAHFQKALGQVVKLRDSQLELEILIGLAGSEAGQGRYASGQSALDRAQDLWRANPDPAWGARLWMQQGNLLVDRHELIEALPHLERSVELARKTGKATLQAATASNLARGYIQVHRYADALPLLREALRLDPSSHQRGITLANIGICEYELNQLDEARRTFEEARRTFVELGSPRLEAWAIGELGLIVWKADRDADRALQYFDRAIERFVNAGDSRNELAFLENRGLVYRDLGRYSEALAVYRQVEERTLRRLGRPPGPNLYKSMGQCLAGLGRYQEAQILLEKSVEMARQIQDSKRIWQGNLELARLYRQIGRPEEADESFLKSLAAIEEARGSLRLPALKTDFFQDKVGGEQSSHLWIIRRATIEHFPLPPRLDLEKVVRESYGQLSDPQSPARLDAAATTLLGPVLKGDLPGSLIVVPSGILYHLPLEALLPAQGGKPFAGISRVTYLPSASTLVHLRSRPPSPLQGEQLLALGDPNYRRPAQAQRAASLMSVQGLGALPYTRDEVLAIRSLFGRWNTTLLLGDEATEQELKRQELTRYSVVHLAAHGWIDSSIPSRSGLVLAPESGSQEDGILQVREIFGLRLNASLVTLSACQSALGRLVTGEGMVGMSQAFFHAGAESVLASLWNVNDEATARFMEIFYSLLREGHPKAEALQQARMEMRKDPRYRHPYYWAPYILIGRGDNTVQFPSRITLIWPLTGALMSVALIWTGIRIRRRRRLNGQRR